MFACAIDRRARGETGSTLVELLVAIAIMGTAVVALLAGTTTVFSTSGANRQAATAGVVARDYAEAVELAVTSDTWCATSYTVSYAPPADYTASASYGACPANTPSTPQFQTVTITATSPNGATETLRTVVREP